MLGRGGKTHDLALVFGTLQVDFGFWGDWMSFFDRVLGERRDAGGTRA